MQVEVYLELRKISRACVADCCTVLMYCIVCTDSDKEHLKGDRNLKHSWQDEEASS